ncbi:MAG: hypothetical protein JWO57_49 [Pseudonocardiales bacterium]|nr:hypothetical protein [Pseudonocardiales bacterium]
MALAGWLARRNGRDRVGDTGIVRTASGWRDILERGLAGSLPRLRAGVWPRVPVSIAIAIATTIVTVFASGPPALRRVADELAMYRGRDIFDGHLWRLPLSGLLAQSWLQWAWTIVVGCALFVALELRLGSTRTAITLGLSHMVPTVVVALWAHAVSDRSLLAAHDFGTSCLIMGAAGALLWLGRSRLLGAALVATLIGDVFLNSTVTVIEHLIALAIGTGSAIVFSAKRVRIWRSR